MQLIIFDSPERSQITWARMDMMSLYGCTILLRAIPAHSLHRVSNIVVGASSYPHRCRKYGLLSASGMELYESSRRSGRRSSQRRRGTNETKNKPNNPNFEGCGKLWQSLGMWAVICIWRTIPGGLMSVETESCEYSTLSFAFGMDPSCYDRPPSLGDPAVGVRMDIVCLVLCCMLL